MEGVLAHWPCSCARRFAAAVNMFSRFTSSKLSRDITLVLLVKIILLILIWFAFVRGERVVVDGDRMAAALKMNSISAVKPQGEHHD